MHVQLITLWEREKDVYIGSIEMNPIVITWKCKTEVHEEERFLTLNPNEIYLPVKKGMKTKYGLDDVLKLSMHRNIYKSGLFLQVKLVMYFNQLLLLIGQSYLASFDEVKTHSSDLHITIS